MGDRLATIDMGRKLWSCAPSGGAGSPCNTMWPGPRPTFVPSGILIHSAITAVWSQQTWAQNWEGALSPFWGGELGLTKCRLGQGLPPYQVASWSIQLFVHNRYGQKIWGLCPFGGGRAGSTSNNVARAEAYLRAKFHLDPSNRLATIHQRHRQTGQTDNGLIA